MRNRLLICIAAAALIAGGGLAHAQATNPGTAEKPAAKAGPTGNQATDQKPANTQAKSAAQPRDEKGRFMKKAGEPSGQNAASSNAKGMATSGAGSGQARDAKGRFMKNTSNQGATSPNARSTTGVGASQGDQSKAANGVGAKKTGANTKQKSQNWLSKAAKSVTGRSQAPAAAH